MLIVSVWLLIAFFINTFISLDNNCGLNIWSKLHILTLLIRVVIVIIFDFNLYSLYWYLRLLWWLKGLLLLSLLIYRQV